MVMWVHVADARTSELQEPPAWASAWGDDDFGLFADWTWGEVVERMRWIAPGQFRMGSTPKELERLPNELREISADELPQHDVRLTLGFWLAETPCTQGVWEAVMGDRPSRFKKGEDWARRPVESVSWDRVQEFLAQLQRRLPKGWEADLPTEAQWEYAARAGTQGAYWWGDGVERGRANWGEEQKGTTPVRRYGANPWGLFDVHGNVWEWCKGYRRTYDARAKVDPLDARHRVNRVQRGGSWFYDAGRARAASRFDQHHNDDWIDIGFRLLLRSVDKSG